MTDKCRFCGQSVRVVSSSEGTNHYRPVADESVALLIEIITSTTDCSHCDLKRECDSDEEYPVPGYAEGWSVGQRRCAAVHVAWLEEVSHED